LIESIGVEGKFGLVVLAITAEPATGNAAAARAAKE
jgi:hypothetical protein